MLCFRNATRTDRSPLTSRPANNDKPRFEITAECADPLLAVASAYPVLRFRREVYGKSFTSNEEIERRAREAKVDPLEAKLWKKKSNIDGGGGGAGPSGGSGGNGGTSGDAGQSNGGTQRQYTTAFISAPVAHLPLHRARSQASFQAPAPTEDVDGASFAMVSPPLPPQPQHGFSLGPPPAQRPRTPVHHAPQRAPSPAVVPHRTGSAAGARVPTSAPMSACSSAQSYTGSTATSRSSESDAGPATPAFSSPTSPASGFSPAFNKYYQQQLQLPQPGMVGEHPADSPQAKLALEEWQRLQEQLRLLS